MAESYLFIASFQHFIFLRKLHFAKQEHYFGKQVSLDSGKKTFSLTNEMFH